MMDADTRDNLRRSAAEPAPLRDHSPDHPPRPVLIAQPLRDAPPGLVRRQPAASVGPDAGLALGQPGVPTSPAGQPASTATRSGAARIQLIFLFVVAAVTLSLDQLSKRLIEARLPLFESVAPIPALEPYFNLTHTLNRGAAFGFFQDGSLLFTLVAFVVAGAIIIYNVRLPGSFWLLRAALGLQLGGALGNLTDRLRQGHVTDFLNINVLPIVEQLIDLSALPGWLAGLIRGVADWPVFNLADTAIVAGVIVLGYVLLTEEGLEGDNSPVGTDSLAGAGSPAGPGPAPTPVTRVTRAGQTPTKDVEAVERLPWDLDDERGADP